MLRFRRRPNLPANCIPSDGTEMIVPQELEGFLGAIDADPLAPIRHLLSTFLGVVLFVPLDPARPDKQQIAMVELNVTFIGNLFNH
jgi:hypothetical protein